MKSPSPLLFIATPINVKIIDNSAIFNATAPTSQTCDDGPPD